MLCKWFKSNDFKADSKFHDPEILSDTASLKYDKDGNSYASTADWDEQQQKEKLNLPTTSLHLLTNEEKKNYSALFTSTTEAMSRVLTAT